jgi:integrase
MKPNATREQLLMAVVPFFGQARRVEDTRRTKFAASTGASQNMLTELFPNRVWTQMRDEWVLSILRPAMDKVFSAVRTRDEFTAAEILKHVSEAEIKLSIFYSVAGKEWRTFADRLPTKRDLVLEKLKEWLEARKPLEEVTEENLFKEVGVYIRPGAWISNPLREVRRKLARVHRKETPTLEKADDAIEFPAGIITLNADVWRLKAYGFHCRRDRLREDVAEVAWPFLREELRSRTSEIRTVGAHCRAFQWVGELLGEAVPDLRTAKLEAVQRSWNSFVANDSKLRQTRWALVQLFSHLRYLEPNNTSGEHSEASRIILWLGSQAVVKTGRAEKDFLNEEELNTLVSCCLEDIEAGMLFLKSTPSLLDASTRRQDSNSAMAVIHWGHALLVLLMAFTGLRPQSIRRLKVNEWMQLLPKVSAISWQHGKKHEANIVAIPVLLARLLDHYVTSTEAIRHELGTDRIFITSGKFVQWRYFDDEEDLGSIIDEFIKRHDIRRNGMLINVTPTVLRRTYVTHQLHKGRSILFVRAQMGHKCVRSTLVYAQYDRFEHPTQVGGALDAYGRRVLDLWHAAVNSLPLPPQDIVISHTIERDRSRHNEDHPTPCAMCKKLHAGAKNITEWEEELEIRTQRLRDMESDSNQSHLLSQERVEYELFLANFEHVRKGATAREQQY